MSLLRLPTIGITNIAVIVQREARFFPVIKDDILMFIVHYRLMPTTENQNHIARPGHSNGTSNCLPSVFNDCEMVGGEPVLDVVNSNRRVFMTRVLHGHERPAASVLCKASHDRPLLTVIGANRPKHGQQVPT